MANYKNSDQIQIYSNERCKSGTLEVLMFRQNNNLLARINFPSFDKISSFFSCSMHVLFDVFQVCQ